jgi:hypothetical protein
MRSPLFTFTDDFTMPSKNREWPFHEPFWYARKRLRMNVSLRSIVRSL